MTGAEHYRAAEECLATVDLLRSSGLSEDERLVGIYAAEAQVHASLAVAAATALSGIWEADPARGVQRHAHLEDACEWQRTAGAEPYGAAS